jgi:hypothetical protein
MFSTRNAVRMKYGIKGEDWKDVFVSCCCMMSGICQLALEGNHRKNIAMGMPQQKMQ